MVHAGADCFEGFSYLYLFQSWFIIKKNRAWFTIFFEIIQNALNLRNNSKRCLIICDWNS